MDEQKCALSDDDLRTALREIKGYVDVTEQDLKQIYLIATEHAKKLTAMMALVANVMTRDVVTIPKEADLNCLSKLMCEKHISGVPVIDNENHVIGIVTEADILHTSGIDKNHKFRDVLRYILGEPSPKYNSGALAADIMTKPVITAKADDNLRDVAKILDQRRIKRLPVVDEHNKIIGIISRGDIIRVLSSL